MVCADGVADIGLLLILLGQTHTVLGVCHLGLLIGHLTYIMKQTGTFCLLGVQTQFCSHYGTEVSGLTCVLQQVLSV